MYRVIVDVDGSVVYQGTPESNGGRCASIGFDAGGVSEFLYPQPCKRSVAVDIPVNTTKFSNGSHRLQVTVQDAANNSSTVYAGTISVANSSGAGGGATAPIGPGSPLALRGAANGTNASDEAKLTARWQGTSKATRTSGRSGQADRVTGRLTTSTGQPISGALLDVTTTAAAQGARTASLASVPTGPTGAWTLTLPRGVSSSTVRLPPTAATSTTPFPSPPRPSRCAFTRASRCGSRPTQRASATRSSFTGTLHGAPIPPGGKQLVLEASSGGEWIQFNTIATDAKGRYRASYRFKFPGPIVYRFRVVSRYEADFPFLAGTSNIVEVHEH